MQSLKFARYAVVILGMLSMLTGGAVRAGAQESPTNDELLKKIDDLEKQLVDVKAQLATMQKPAAPPAVAQSALPQSGAPVPQPNISNLLGSTTLSGFIDTYYNYNSNQPANLTNGTQPFTPFSNQFGLNMVELILDKPPDASASRTGYHVSLGFGQAMNAVNGTDPGGLGFAQYLKEAYFSYLAPAGKGLQIDVGKFVTPAGAEVIESKDNWNYTRSVLFYYAIPYFHYGMRAKYTFNDKYSVTGYLVNGWNNVVAVNSGKTYGVSLGWNPTKKIGVTQNYLAGPQLAAATDPGGSNSSWRQLWDTVVTYSPTTRLAFMVNGDYGRGDRFCLLNSGSSCITPSSPVAWYGGAGYVKYAFNDKYTVAARYEYLGDPDGFVTAIGPGLGQHWQEGTFTLQRTLASHIISRLEYRHDETSQPYFLRGSSALEKGQNTMTAGVVFTFSTGEVK